jgi:sortase A
MTSSHSRAPVLRRLVHLLGTALVVLGIVALLWGLAIWRWEDPATGLYTRWQQRELSSQLASLRSTYAPDKQGTQLGADSKQPDAKRSVGASVKSLATRLRLSTKSGNALGRIRVDRLGLEMTMVNGSDPDALVRGPGVDPRAYLPGEGELVYVAGHRTTYGAPFAHIDRLRAGDEIEMEMPYGTFVYRVTSHVIVPADDVGRLKSRGREEIALQACHPRFTARERYIVYALPVTRRSRVTEAAVTASTTSP